MADIGSSLTTAFDYTFGRLVARLEGLTDDEYFWQPVPGCWTVRRDANGRWRIDGDGGDAGGAPAPDPPPVTTIAWRIGHIGLTFIGFGDRLFADGTIGLDDVDFAPSAEAATGFLSDTYRTYWRDRLDEVDEERWWSPLGPAFGPYADDSTTDLALHVLDELVHHAAEIGLLRDLYLRRDLLGTV